MIEESMKKKFKEYKNLIKQILNQMLINLLIYPFNFICVKIYIEVLLYLHKRKNLYTKLFLNRINYLLEFYYFGITLSYIFLNNKKLPFKVFHKKFLGKRKKCLLDIWCNGIKYFLG